MKNLATTVQPETGHITVSEVSYSDTMATATSDETNESESVYFCTTESAEKSLLSTIKWSWVLITFAICIALFELLAVCSTLLMAYKGTDQVSVVVVLVKELIYLPISTLLIWHGIQYGTQMRTAIRYRDNPALTKAFYHQGAYLKWAFFQLITPIAMVFVEPVLKILL